MVKYRQMNTFVTSVLPVPVSGQALILPRPADRDSWEFWLPRWISRKATTTRTVYAAEIRNFLDFIGWKPIPTLQTTDIEEYQQTLVNRGLKQNTVCRCVATVCSLVSYIHRRDLAVMPQNVGAGVERVKATNELAGRILSEAECLRMFDRESNPRNLALLRVLYSSGCRISEVLNLRWKDVVWEESSAKITVLGKGSKIRTVNIYGASVEALRAILPAGECEDIGGGGGVPSQHVFRTCHGPLKRIYAVAVVRRAAKRAGIKKPVSPHWLRHASATHALDRSAPLTLVSATLGHANLAITGRYLHIRPGESMGKFHAL
jgi:site-specific recombinase XerD